MTTYNWGHIGDIVHRAESQPEFAHFIFFVEFSGTAQFGQAFKIVVRELSVIKYK